MNSKKLICITPLAILLASLISLPLSVSQEEVHSKTELPVSPPKAASKKTEEVPPEETNDVPIELNVEVYQEGDCTLKEPVQDGDTLTVHYDGNLVNTNEQFESSWDKEEPFTFTMGKGQVVEGWEVGLTGMCVGERRVLTIPPNLGYGEEGIPPIIPPNAALKFNIVLLHKE